MLHKNNKTDSRSTHYRILTSTSLIHRKFMNLLLMLVNRSTETTRDGNFYCNMEGVLLYAKTRKTYFVLVVRELKRIFFPLLYVKKFWLQYSHFIHASSSVFWEGEYATTSWVCLRTVKNTSNVEEKESIYKCHIKGKISLSQQLVVFYYGLLWVHLI